MITEKSQQNLAPHQYEDEMSLIDIFRVLVERKYIIAFVAIISVVVSATYALTAPEVYKSNVYFTQPSMDDIKVLNIQSIQGNKSNQSIQRNQRNQDNQGNQGNQGNQDITNYTEIEVFDEFVKNMNSRLVQTDFIIKEIIPLIDDSSSKEINPGSYREYFEINTKDKKNMESSVSLRWNNAEESAELLNKYFAYVAKITRSTLTADVNYILQKIILGLESRIKFKVELAKQEKLDAIVRLEEEIKKSLVINLRKSTDLNKILTDKKLSDIVYNSDLLSLLISNTDELKARLRILKTRESNDAFIPSLRSDQKELGLLRKIKINPSLLTPITITQVASAPQSRIEPKKRLIVALGLVVGLVLGVFSALMWNFIKSVPKEQEKSF